MRVVFIFAILFVVSGCASSMTEQEREERKWRLEFLAEDFARYKKWCRSTKGFVVTTDGSIGTRCDERCMRSARCLSRQELHDIFPTR